MKDLVTEDEARVGAVESWLEAGSVVELPVTWPDLPPAPLVSYEIRVETGGASGNETGFTVRLNILGDKGDLGLRPLRDPIGTQPSAVFKPYNVPSSQSSSREGGRRRAVA